MQSPLVVALDVPDESAALDLAAQLDPDLCRLKVGLELYTAVGPSVVEKLHRAGFELFLDLKFHDIPNSVAGACAAAAAMGVWMMNVHALAGRRALEAAANAVERSGSNCRLVAVTVLTSMDETDFAQIGFSDRVEHRVAALAQLASDAGLDGVVCSPREVARLRQQLQSDFLLVTPGVRPASHGSDDQRRTATPLDAVASGANYLVVGRPITQAASPGAALAAMHAELVRAFNSGRAG